MKLQMKQIAGLAAALKTPFTVSATAPEDPVENEVWFDTDNLALYIYIQDTNGPVWVEVQ